MYRFIVNLFVTLFVMKKYRAGIKAKLLGWPDTIRVRKRAKQVGKYFACLGTSPTRVNRHTTIGNYVGINGLIIYGNGEVIIGDHVIIAAECVICSDNHNYEGTALPFDNITISKRVTINDNVWLGARSIILPGTTIGEGAIVQAGAVVHGEVPPCAIVGGNPAVVIKYRDKERYYSLKEKKSYLWG